MALSLAALADITTQVVNAAAGTTVQLGAFKKIMMLARVLRMFRLLRHSKVRGPVLASRWMGHGKCASCEG